MTTDCRLSTADCQIELEKLYARNMQAPNLVKPVYRT
jgi:hypothetical protein